MEIGGGRKSGIKRVAWIESSLVIRNRNVQSNVYEPPVRCQWDPARINKQIIERIRGIYVSMTIRQVAFPTSTATQNSRRPQTIARSNSSTATLRPLNEYLPRNVPPRNEFSPCKRIRVNRIERNGRSGKSNSVFLDLNNGFKCLREEGDHLHKGGILFHPKKGCNKEIRNCLTEPV